MNDSPSHCLNCEAPLLGPYCAACGQREQHRVVPLRHLLQELIHEWAHVDEHVLGTFRALLARPGQLTLEYLEGRRVRHIAPLRLYLITSFFLFLLLGTLAPRMVHVNGATKGTVVTAGKGARVAQEPSAPAPQSPFERRMEQGGKRVMENPVQFLGQVVALLPKVMFILLPVFALLMKLLYVRRGNLYVAHLIFALHTHTAAFLMFLAAIGLGMVPGLAGWATLALFLGLPTYLLLALRRTYGQSWPKTLLKGALLLGAYAPLVLACAIGAILWAVYQAG
jgi:hypothetical protein